MNIVNHQKEIQEQESKRRTIKKCPICGEHLLPLSKVCPSCGNIVEDEGAKVNTVMSELDKICGSYSNLSIRFYDYILLLMPIIYLIWVIIVIVKIVRSNTKYNNFVVLKNKALILYGDNPEFRSYLVHKDTEMEKQRKKNRISHAIIYALIILDAILLVFSLMSI